MPHCRAGRCPMLPGARRKVWVLRDGLPRVVVGHAGLDDDSFTEIVAGDLKPGDQVIDPSRDRRRTRRHAMPPLLGEARNGRARHRGSRISRGPIVVGDIEVHALRGVNLTVERGEFVAIMGSSGSGKSTLMTILGCLDRPTSGQYCFEGVDVAGLSEPELADIRSQRLGFVFQSFNLLARTSALENVVLPLFYSARRRRRRERAANERARGAGELSASAERERNTPGQLSGGQQQRVAIARALINRPSVLLADEPTGNLDTRTSHEIMEMLRKLNREQGVTVIVVTHEADIAAYADRIDDDARRQDRFRSATRRRSAGRPDAAAKPASPGMPRFRPRQAGRRCPSPRRGYWPSCR